MLTYYSGINSGRVPGAISVYVTKDFGELFLFASVCVFICVLSDTHSVAEWVKFTFNFLLPNYNLCLTLGRKLICHFSN